ncbi:hypothetical protein CLF_109048 [Clonorchis sinensis]|uniref:Saposin B-type domain-containing protein n=1 Tax=Clonorchis sinensis TaxID=79923 RepID=G7YS75_CLOSI|nr:hypothetical protein CLF_109048 [Clonorchis sinensis]
MLSKPGEKQSKYQGWGRTTDLLVHALISEQFRAHIRQKLIVKADRLNPGHTDSGLSKMARNYPENPLNYPAYKIIYATQFSGKLTRACVTCQYLVQSMKKVSQYAKENSLSQDASSIACSLTDKDKHSCDQYMPDLVNLVHDYLESYDPSDACQEKGVDSPVEDPQTNGLTESYNRTIKEWTAAKGDNLGQRSKALRKCNHHDVGLLPAASKRLAESDGSLEAEFSAPLKQGRKLWLCEYAPEVKVVVAAGVLQKPSRITRTSEETTECYRSGLIKISRNYGGHVRFGFECSILNIRWFADLFGIARLMNCFGNYCATMNFPFVVGLKTDCDKQRPPQDTRVHLWIFGVIILERESILQNGPFFEVVFEARRTHRTDQNRYVMDVISLGTLVQEEINNKCCWFRYFITSEFGKSYFTRLVSHFVKTNGVPTVAVRNDGVPVDSYMSSENCTVYANLHATTTVHKLSTVVDVKLRTGQEVGDSHIQIRLLYMLTRFWCRYLAYLG